MKLRSSRKKVSAVSARTAAVTTSTATPSPTPDASTTLNPGATEGNWDYPTSAAGLDNSPLESLPEDSWAEN